MLHQTYADEGVSGIAVAGGCDPDQLVQAFRDTTGIAVPRVHDEDTYPQYAWPPSIAPYPRQALIGRDGTLVYAASEHQVTALETALVSALAEPVP